MLYLLAATFGLSSATALKIASAIMLAFKAGQLTLGKTSLLLAGTGIGAIVIIGIFAVGTVLIAKKVKMGKAALTAW
jgi:hypothetical protein